jgi:hypothetical protein
VLGDRRRLALVPLALGLIVTTGYALVLAGGDEPLAIVTIAAGTCAAALALRAKGQALALAAGLCCLVALLAPAIVRSARIVEVDASATGGTGAHPLPWVGLLSSYLARHDHHAYYELAAHSYPHAAPFIVKDGRPVLVLMNFNRPIVGVRRLASEARAGRVRYALIEGRCGTARLGSIGRCPATLQWLRRHSVDVTAATGLHTRGVLFRIARRSGRRAAGRGGHGG